MRYVVLIVFLLLGSLLTMSQSSEMLIASLKSINRAVAQKSCASDSAAAISHRAMNVFLADKTGYLPVPAGLSYYTNYVSFNTAEGKITVKHNFQQHAGADAPIQKLFSFGVDITVANSYAKAFSDNRFENELGVSAGYTWLGKVTTRFADCTTAPPFINQKQAMDALRESLLQLLITEIENREKAFQLQIEAIDTASIPKQNAAGAKALMQQNFLLSLIAEYEEKFVTRQAALLTSTASFRLIHTWWTSLEAHIPLLFPAYTVAPSLAAPFSNRHPWPSNITLSHTRLWESRKNGRLFFTAELGLLADNSKLNYGLSKLTAAEYKTLGGTERLQLIDPGSSKLYIGSYQNFLFPSMNMRFVYFPPSSHVGISTLLQQNFGTYHLLNARVGVPIVLLNSKKIPAVTMECYLLLFDISGKTREINRQGKTSLGLSIGIPFSRLMY